MSQNYTWPSSAAAGANPSVGTNGQSIPTSSTLVGAENPSGDLTPLQVDAGGNLLTSLAAGTALIGTVKIDQTTPGTTNGVVVNSSALPAGAATNSLQTSGNTLLGTIITDMINGSQITQITGTVPLPSGAATAANQATEIASLSSIDGKLGSLGQKAMAGSAPVVIASDQSAVPVSISGNQAINLVQVAGASVATGHGTATGAIRVELPTDGTGVVGAAQNGTWTVQPGNTANTTAWLVKASGAGTATLSNVNGSASSVSLLASNSARRAATFFNDSTATLYLKFGATASTTSYTVQIPTLGYYEVPQPAYTGAIDGIWSAANGAVRISEIT